MAKILVMDNEEDILSSLRTILEKEDYKVTCVNTGNAALFYFKETTLGKFDLVILDIMMPDLSGWDVFGHIMKIDPNQKVMFLSVLEISPERKKELEKYGNVEYVLKPFDKDALLQKIKSMVGTETKNDVAPKPS